MEQLQMLESRVEFLEKCLMRTLGILEGMNTTVDGLIEYLSYAEKKAADAGR